MSIFLTSIWYLSEHWYNPYNSKQSDLKLKAHIVKDIAKFNDVNYIEQINNSFLLNPNCVYENNSDYRKYLQYADYE